MYIPSSGLSSKKKSHLKNFSPHCYSVTSGNMEFSIPLLGQGFCRRWEGGVDMEEGDQGEFQKKSRN